MVNKLVRSAAARQPRAAGRVAATGATQARLSETHVFGTLDFGPGGPPVVWVLNVRSISLSARSARPGDYVGFATAVRRSRDPASAESTVVATGPPAGGVYAEIRQLGRTHHSPGRRASHTETPNENPFDSQRCYSRAARAAAFMLDTASVDVGGLRVLFSSNFWNPSLSTVNITSSSPRPEIPRSSDTT